MKDRFEVRNGMIFTSRISTVIGIILCLVVSLFQMEKLSARHMTVTGKFRLPIAYSFLQYEDAYYEMLSL